jgi:hypothetical protein
MSQEMKPKNSELIQFIESRYLELDETEIYNAFEFAIPNESRFENLSENEADEIYRNILPHINACRKNTLWQRFSTKVSFVVGAAVASLVIYFFPMIMSSHGQIELKEGISDKQRLERIRLMFNIAKREKGRPVVIERGVPGEKYAVENDVLIRYEITKPGYVCLTHYLPSGRIEILNKDSTKLQKAGWYDIQESGRVMVVALAGMPGKHSFYGIFSTIPVECVQAANKVIKGVYGSDTIIDSFSIEVD